MKKETRGRKKKDNPALARIDIRLTDGEKESIQTKADRDEVSVSEWIRAACTEKD